MKKEMQYAWLSNETGYTVFRFDDKVIRFRAPYSLERYTAVKEWDHGYLVVMAKYKHNDKPEEDIKKIADEAEMIVNGYAFSLCPEGYRVLNLNCPDKATVFSPDMDVLETSMDDIEIHIVKGYLKKNLQFMEDEDAEIL